MDETPEACVVHETKGRLRLRIPAKRHDAAFFAQLERELLEKMPKARIETNAATASVLICSADPRRAVDVLGERAPFRISNEPEESAFEDTSRRIKGLNEKLARWSGGANDGRILIFAALIASAIYQGARGQMLAPATTLLWYAGEALRFWSSQAKSSRP